METKDVVYLTPEFNAAADPDISFNGQKILFAGRKTKNDLWQIWEMNIDGSNKKQITTSEGNCYMPVYAGSRFYLNDERPTPQIIYVSTAHNWRNLSENELTLSLYGTDREGKSTYRLGYNLYNDFSPDISADGRIVYTSWQLSAEKHSITGRYAFMGINNDGTDIMTFYGNHTDPVYKDMIAISDTDYRIYFIESGQSLWLGGGNIAELSFQRPLNSYKRVTQAVLGLYHSPCPLPDGGLLSSYRKKTGDDVFSIYRINQISGKREEEIYKQSGWHSIDVHLLRKHPKVKGRSNWLIPGSESGVLYCLDSYMTDRPEIKTIEPGSIKYIRVFEGLPLKGQDLKLFKKNEFTIEREQWINPRKILGTAPVQKDGSFHVRVPAHTPLNFQLLDKNYLTISKQEAWIWVSGNENRGCIGCHENRELSPPNVLVKAITKPANDLTVSEKHKIFDFKNNVSPIIKTKCATSNCHASGNANPNLEESTLDKMRLSSRQIFEKLLIKSRKNSDEPYVIPGNAKESPLIRHIFDLEKDGNRAPFQIRSNGTMINSKLTKEEKLTFIEWVDSGAFWDLSVLSSRRSQMLGN
jgi:hypothetical protein